MQLNISNFKTAYMEGNKSKKTAFYLVLIFVSIQVNAQVTDSIALPSIPGKLYWNIRPEKSIVKGNSVTIIAGEKTDMFRDPNVTYNTDNAPKLMFRPGENFVLTASIEHSFSSKWDGGAIVLRGDSLNWIKFCFEKDYTGARRVVSVVTKDISDDCNSVSLNSNKVYYKIAKADNVITLYYGTDGKKWFLVRHLQFDLKPGYEVGFLSQSPTGKSCTVKFADIYYSPRKIKDPYAGE
jgi:regulation of enolase protein 1 (concanavalin A-like superfamily)